MLRTKRDKTNDEGANVTLTFVSLQLVSACEAIDHVEHTTHLILNFYPVYTDSIMCDNVN